MANNITKISDYTGFNLLKDNSSDKDSFSDFAFDIEKEILTGKDDDDYGLLGDEVYIALIADLDINNDPQTAPYINLINGVNYTQSDGLNTQFCGLKKMLINFVYAKYLINNIVTQSSIGTFKLLTSNAENTIRKNVNRNAFKRWNKGVEQFNGQVYDYILFYQSSFTNWEFTRQSKYLTLGIK